MTSERRGLQYASAVLLVSATLGVAAALRSALDLPDLEMLFLLAVMIAAAWFGRGPSILAAALGVACYDFFFVPPVHTFTVTDHRYFLTFGMMFGVGLVMSELVGRLRRQEREAVAREQQTARLATEARQAALRATREEMRSSLLSAVSHDLRTPLAAVTGAATSLRDDANLPEHTRRELVESIVGEAARLERLVANLLDMTRLESGALVLKRDWVPLDEVIGSALTRLEDRLGPRPIRVDLAKDVPLLHVDPVLFEQVFVNLVENAEKYTPPEAAIEITARGERDRVAIELRDHGSGLPDGTEVRVFEKFFRGQHAGTAGAGLGLAICKAIVDAHGGTITAENAAGGGACFRITIPTRGAPPSIDEVTA